MSEVEKQLLLQLAMQAERPVDRLRREYAVLQQKWAEEDNAASAYRVAASS